MNKYWSRDNTKEWICQLEHRISDIGYYLKKTINWCEEYGINDNSVVFMCSFITCIWVSQMRGENISFAELMEIIGVEEWESAEEKLYELDDRFANLDHDELLKTAIDHFNNNKTDWF